MDNKRCKFPLEEKKSSILLSVVVPAYNEESRCKFAGLKIEYLLICLSYVVAVMLDECLEYFAQRKNANSNFSYEIIVVSDGSTDKTVELAHSYARQYSTNIIRVLELQPNRGKGGAVKMVRIKN